MSCAPWNPAGCVGDVAKSVAGDAFSSIAHDFAKAAGSAVNWLWTETSSATAIHLGGAGFELDIGIVATIAITVAVGLFVIQLITSTLRRDAGGLVRAAKGLVVAFIGAGVAITATNLLLSAIDALSVGVVQVATGGTVSQLGHSVLPGNTLVSATSNPAATILLSLLALAAVVIVWAALMIRKVLIVVSAVFAPLAFAGSLADVTASWVRRWIEVTVALIVSKLVLVLIFVIGLGMFVRGTGQANGGSGQVATQVISGLLVLVLAGFAPWLSLKLVHWSGDQFHHLHAMAATSAGGAQRLVQAPRKVAPWASRAIPAAAAAGGAAAGGAAVGGTVRGGAADGSGFAKGRNKPVPAAVGQSPGPAIGNDGEGAPTVPLVGSAGGDKAMSPRANGYRPQRGGDIRQPGPGLWRNPAPEERSRP